MIILGYINLGILLFLVGLVISVYVHTDKKINESSERTDKKIEKLSDEIKENNKALTDRIDRLYDILVHMGFREEKIRRDKAANE
jgi:prefoldin subunit 5